MGWMSHREAMGKVLPLLLQGKFTYEYDRMPLSARNLSWRKRANLLKCGLDMVLKKESLWSVQPTIQIEPSSLCNLACPLCTASTAAPGRKNGSMSMKTFHTILDEIGDVLVSAILYNSGEPFINKNLPEMIAACTAHGIITLTSTNGQFVQTLDEALEIVDAGLTALIIAMDGSTQEIYEVYRKGGDLEKVKRCITLIEKAKAIRNAPYPYTNVRTVVMKHNQDDLPNIERIARELGANMVSSKTCGFSEIEESKDYEATREGWTRYEYMNGQRQTGIPIRCPFPFRQPTIFWDGTVVGCQRDFEKEEAFGRIGEQPFSQIWNGAKARRLRKMIRHGPVRPAFCARCRKQDSVRDNILFATELRPESH